MLSIFQYFETKINFLVQIQSRHFVFTDSRNAVSVKMVFTIYKQHMPFQVICQIFN